MNDKTNITTDTTASANPVVRFLGTLILCTLPLLMSGSTPPNMLEKVKNHGFIQMLSINGPSTVYEGPFGDAGFEYELAKSFADDLGVELSVITQNNLTDLLESIKLSDAHFAAAGLSITDERKAFTHFTMPYSFVSQLVVYKRDAERPKTIEDLIGKDIIVVSKSSHANTLKNLKVEYPELKWREKDNAEMSDMLEIVHRGDADITIIDSTAFTTNRVIYPRARSGFYLTEPEGIAWAFPKSNDDSLLKAANTFLTRSINNGQVDELVKKYFSRPSIDESNALTLSQRIEERLPEWEPLFKKTAEKYDLDWLFLAAVSYQESLWNKDAKSFTGVRGLMMLTNQTAKGLGIKDRTDPEQSIDGGARYFLSRHKRLPEGIKEPDRTWMALAAYNIGLGHLEDARVITQRQGGDPNLWDDVKARLPLLAKAKYYRNTRHGYARGWEPVSYVKRIRSYHKILIWYYDNLRKKEETEKIESNTTLPSGVSNDNMSQL